MAGILFGLWWAMLIAGAPGRCGSVPEQNYIYPDGQILMGVGGGTGGPQLC